MLGSQVPLPSVRGCRQSTSPAGVILLQGGAVEFPKMAVARLGGQSLTTGIVAGEDTLQGSCTTEHLG